MPLFLALIAVGLVGLLLMAIPGFSRHGHAPSLGHSGHGGPGLHEAAHGAAAALHAGAARALPAGHSAGAPQASPTPAARGSSGGDAASTATGLNAARLIPAPRVLFSVLALEGAFGCAFTTTLGLSVPLAAIAALIPALLLERFLLAPIWDFLFRFEGKPAASLDDLLMEEAEAVTPFRNGRGIIRAELDGRVVQLSARLKPEQAALPVGVGDRVRIESIDGGRERAEVSLQ
jgi:hypothetical protein